LPPSAAGRSKAGAGLRGAERFANKKTDASKYSIAF
jgi:hypothetical protein